MKIHLGGKQRNIAMAANGEINCDTT